MALHHAAGLNITLHEAFEQAAEEIILYHQEHGFPSDLTNHSGRDAPRKLSHQGDYVDRGN